MAAGSIYFRRFLQTRVTFRDSLRTFCASTNAAVKNKTPKTDDVSAITSESKPNNHSNSHIGQFYLIPDNAIGRKFNYCVPNTFARQKKLFGDDYIMIRKPALDIIQQLKYWAPGETHPRFVIYGEPGCGKTLTLAHVVHYALKAGYFVLLVPRVFRWVHSWKEIQLSKTRPNRFDQLDESVIWLKMMRQINADFLSKIQTSQEYTWGKMNATEKGEPLLNVVDQGIKRISYATDAVGVVLKELRKETSFKVLYAVDEFNGFFGATSLKDSSGNWIKTKDLSLVHHFRKALHPEHGLSNAAMVFALSRTGIHRNYNPSHQISDLLGKHGESAVAPFTSIHIPEYSNQEFEMCMKFYRDKGGFSKELTPVVLKEISILSGNLGSHLSRICGPG